MLFRSERLVAQPHLDQQRHQTSHAIHTCPRTAWALLPKKSAHCNVCWICLKNTSIGPRHRWSSATLLAAQEKLLVRNTLSRSPPSTSPHATPPGAVAPVAAVTDGSREPNFVVAQNLAVGLLQGPFNHSIWEVVLGASDPPDASWLQWVEMGKVHVSLVKEHDFAGAPARADFAGPLGVVVPGRVDEAKEGPVTVEVQPPMALGGGLASPGLGPIPAGGDQLKGGRVHHADRRLAARGQPFARAAGGEAWRRAAQMIPSRPEQLLGPGGRSLVVGVGKGVARRRRRATKGRQPPPVKSPAIAAVIETQGGRALREEQRNHLAPGTKRARLGGGAGVTGQLRDQMRGNEIAQRTQNGEFRAGW